MAQTKEVILKWHKVVPFPWTIRKIHKAGREPTEFLLNIGAELSECEDAKSESTVTLLSTLRELGLML